MREIIDIKTRASHWSLKAADHHEQENTVANSTRKNHWSLLTWTCIYFTIIFDDMLWNKPRGKYENLNWKSVPTWISQFTTARRRCFKVHILKPYCTVERIKWVTSFMQKREHLDIFPASAIALGGSNFKTISHGTFSCVFGAVLENKNCWLSVIMLSQLLGTWSAH